MERAPKQGGGYRSPWAVKKVARRFVDSQNKEFSSRLLEEADILRALEHPNIIGYRTLTKATDGTWCLAMEKAEHSLLDLIEQRLDNKLGPFLPPQIARVGVDIARALDYLHGDKLLMHGDMKSGNVLIFGDFKLAKLCDFGVTLPLAEAYGVSKANSYYVGTQAWSAPEVISMDSSHCDADVPVSCQADVFAYGLTIWEMLSLCLPHADHLEDDDDDGADEDDYLEALGTRPSLPELPVEPDYSNPITVFIACTETIPTRRPRASEVATLWQI